MATNVTQVPCVSYAPFRRDGHTPFDAKLVIAAEHIEADLRTLATVTRCVRSYGLDNGLDALPAVAQRLGMRVVLGVWIGREPAVNQQQLDRALQLAAAYPDTVQMLVVGNEVLLRRELTPEALAALLAQARKRSTVPVAYADVWEFWLRHAKVLREHVDVVAIHVLPYWEDDPVHVDDAVVHVSATVAQLRRAFAPQRVWLAETGWPAAGRQRGPAVPGPVQQTTFVRGMLQAATVGGVAVDMNFIEAFDQPWKRALEGAAGGHWGLFSADGQPRVTLQGAATPRGDAPLVLACALGAALLALLIWGGATWRATKHRGIDSVMMRTEVVPSMAAWPSNAINATAAAASGAGLGLAAALQWRVLVDSSLDVGAWAVGLLVAGVALLCASMAAACVVHGACRQGRASAMPGALHAWRRDTGNGLRQRMDGECTRQRMNGESTRQRMLATVHLMWLAATAVMALQLAFDARYRDVWWPLMLATTLAVLVWRLSGVRLERAAVEERVLGVLLLVCGAMVAWQEGLANAQAYTAVFTCLGAAVATLMPAHKTPDAHGPRAASPQHSRRPAAAQASSAATSAGADQPAA